MSYTPRILAIIPCYNEAGAIGNLLQEFQTLDIACDTLVIDDGSHDQTSHIASKYSQVIRFNQNQGVCAAVKKGISYAKEHGYDFCVQIDGDGQHIPTEISKLLDAYNVRPANIIIGSRYYRRIAPLFSSINRIGGLIVTLQLYWLFKKTWLYDATSGMRMMDKTAIDYFDRHMDASAADAVIIAQGIKGGLSIHESPVTMRPRLSGISSLCGFKGVVFLFRVICQMTRIRFS